MISGSRDRAAARARAVHGRVVSVDPAARSVRIGHADGRTSDEPYDALVLSPGMTNGFSRRAPDAPFDGRAVHLFFGQGRPDRAASARRRGRAPPGTSHRWGSILGVQPDGLRVFDSRGRSFRMPRWFVDRVLFPLVLRRGISRGIWPAPDA
jgi:hypothetical protein